MPDLDIADFITENLERRRNTEKKDDDYVDAGMIVPNPNTGKMRYIYNAEFEGHSELQIFSSRGRMIKSYTLLPEGRSLDIDLSDQQSGLYVYRILSEGEIYPGNKIILQK